MTRKPHSIRLTFAQRYNAEAVRLMPGQDLLVDPSIDCAGMIDDIVFHRSEYLGGMANVICELVHLQTAA